MAKDKKKLWDPKIWMGMGVGGWLKLLFKNGFGIDLPMMFLGVIVSILSITNSSLHLLKWLVYGRKIKKIRIKEPPVFIIGHWRTGTTLLFELLRLDPKFTAPNFYQCLAAHHFLISERLFQKFPPLTLPSKRPMDNMTISWTSPQEDEFAFCNLGIPSPYWLIAFPNRPLSAWRYIDLECLDSKALARWKKAWIGFLKEIYYKRPGHLLLKSPTHTWRIKTILEIFPDAKFIHMIRNPYEVYPSAIHLWKKLFLNQSLQIPKFKGLEQIIISLFLWINQQMERDKKLIPAGNFVEMKYEDLISSPEEQMRKVYDSFGLGDFEAIQPKIREYFSQRDDYQRNAHRLSSSDIQRINQNWGEFIQKQGYELMTSDNTRGRRQLSNFFGQSRR